MGADSDAFNRWEAGQDLAAEIMLEWRHSAERATISPRWAMCWREAADDPAFAAQMLVPPTESELAAPCARPPIPTRYMPRARR